MRHLKTFWSKLHVGGHDKAEEEIVYNLPADIEAVFPNAELEGELTVLNQHQLELLAHLYTPNAEQHEGVFAKCLLASYAQDLVEVYEFLLRVNKGDLLINFINSFSTADTVERFIAGYYFQDEKIQERKEFMAELVSIVYADSEAHLELRRAMRLIVLDKLSSVYGRELLEGRMKATELFLEIFSVSFEPRISAGWYKIKPVLFGFVANGVFTDVFAGEMRELVAEQSKAIAEISKRLTLANSAKYKSVQQLEKPTRAINDFLESHPQLMLLLNILEAIAALAEFAAPYGEEIGLLMQKAGMNLVYLTDYPERTQEYVAFVRHHLAKLAQIVQINGLNTLPALDEFTNIRRRKGVVGYIYDMALVIGPQALLQIGKIMEVESDGAVRASLEALTEIERMIKKTKFAGLEESLGDSYLTELAAAKLVSQPFFEQKGKIFEIMKHNAALIEKVLYNARLHITQGGEKFTASSDKNRHLNLMEIEFLHIRKLDRLDEFFFIVQPK
jgi:hypothetical protein